MTKPKVFKYSYWCNFEHFVNQRMDHLTLSLDDEHSGASNGKNGLHTDLVLFFIRQNVPVNRIAGALLHLSLIIQEVS